MRVHCEVPGGGTNRCRALWRAQGSRDLPEQLKQSSVGGNETSQSRPVIILEGFGLCAVSDGKPLEGCQRKLF